MTWVGALASAISAYIAVRHAARARNYADSAKEQISTQRRIFDLSKLDALWKETYESIADFGAGSTLIKLRGKNPARTSRKVQDYLEQVKSQIHNLKSVSNVDSQIKKLELKLKNFSDSIEPKDLKDTGAKLLSGLTDLNSSIQSILLLDKERIML